jgi:tRNA(adenine34) deaminase
MLGNVWRPGVLSTIERGLGHDGLPGVRATDRMHRIRRPTPHPTMSADSQIPSPDAWRPERRHMAMALAEARRAAEAGEVPVGAVILRGGTLLAKAHNQVELLKDPTAHAEILAVTQAAAAMGDWRLEGTVLYVTKEPCPMCAGAIVQARIPIVVWGMTDPLRGGACSQFKIFDHPSLNHRVRFVPDFLGEECRELVQAFFRERRAKRPGTTINGFDAG